MSSGNWVRWGIPVHFVDRSFFYRRNRGRNLAGVFTTAGGEARIKTHRCGRSDQRNKRRGVREIEDDPLEGSFIDRTKIR
ncbi:hypothetical protein TNCV_4518731 [Trichonephila clavipes]|nr:hypothetical protein TNCV_4518731 [Trichonephila clavipes]